MYHRRSFESIGNRITLMDDWSAALKAAVRNRVWIFRWARDAERAFAWCRAHGIRVPRRVSILCLENAASLIPAGITTCTPDFDAIGYLLAHTLIGDIPIRKSRHGYLVTRAMVHERVSTPS